MSGSGPAQTSWHAQPGWKLVVAHDGTAACTTADGHVVVGGALVIAPGVEHRASTTSAYTAVLFEPGARGATGCPHRPVALEPQRLGGALDGLAGSAVADLDAACDDLLGRVERIVGMTPGPLDRRLREALDRLAGAESIAALADEVGVSDAHLRRLAQVQLGAPLARARSWARLRAAVAAAGPLVEAAVVAGFADQAHLSRTARRLAGRTPREITASVVRAGGPATEDVARG